MKALTVEASAKLNLGLEVVGRRQDGYHELATVFQEIDLADRLTLEPAAAISLEVEGLPAPGGEENLVLQAARSLAAEAGAQGGARILLEKRIPAGAGLGGGSSDAAAALRGLDRLWQTNLGYRRLSRLASGLGSDVPFFLVGGTALGLGRGEVVCPLPELPDLAAVLLCPDESLATPAVFREADFSLTVGHKYNIMSRFAQYVLSGKGLEELVRNDLQQAATKLLPRIEGMCDELRAAGALASALTGSGSCVYGLFEDRTAAGRALDKLTGGGMRFACRLRRRSRRW